MVLDGAQAVPDCLDQVVGAGEGDVAEPAASQQGPDAFNRVEVRCIGRQLVDGQPVPAGDPGAHPGVQVHVQVVPDEHDRAAELLVSDLQQVTVVGPGEGLASVASAVVTAGPIDQPGAFTRLVAGQGGD